MKKRFLLAILPVATLLSFSACGKLDVVGDTSIKSFGKVLEIVPEPAYEDAAYEGWSLTSPDGSARFIWSKDYSKSQTYDVLIETDAKPFLDAGLDASKLPKGMLEGDKILIGKDLGNDAPVYKGEATPLNSYEQIVKLYRSSIKYHAALDHFGVDLAGGNAFEWAKDMGKNPQIYLRKTWNDI